jgi:hypothetical protein
MHHAKARSRKEEPSCFLCVLAAWRAMAFCVLSASMPIRISDGKTGCEDKVNRIP